MPPDVPKINAQERQDHNSGLHAQAADLLSQRAKHAPPPLKLDQDGSYTITSGNMLFSIASSSLAMRGELPDQKSDDYVKSVQAEMDRIIEETKRAQPRIASRITRDHIEVGWKLKIRDTSPSQTTAWTEAKPHEWTVVKNGEHVLAPNDAWLVVQPGGDAILNPGSKAIVAPHGKIEKALPGSFVVAMKGSEVHDYGATITRRDSGAVIIAEDLNSLHLQSKGSEQLSASQNMDSSAAGAFLLKKDVRKQSLSTRLMPVRRSQIVSSDVPT